MKFSARLLKSILFFGSDDFSSVCLKRILVSQQPREVQAVVPFHSNVPIKKLALASGLTVHQAPKHGDGWKGWKLPTTTQGKPFDLAVVVSFGYFLPTTILTTFKSGTLNVHPSLLPRYRGSSPIQYAILNGDKETGVSIIDLNPHQFDAGKILNQQKVIIQPREFYSSLHDRLALVGSELLAETIDNLNVLQQNSKAQDESLVTKAPKITAADTRIDWNSQTMERIYAMYRAFGEKYQLSTTLRGKNVILQEILDPQSFNLPKIDVGLVSYNVELDAITVGCNDGTVAIKKLRVSGKNTVDAANFRNGYLHSGDIYFD